MTNHTPGPWTQESDGSLVMCGQVVGLIGPDTASRDTLVANARLISAAPELLSALDRLMLAAYGVANSAKGVPDKFRKDMGDAMMIASAAIARAEGRNG